MKFFFLILLIFVCACNNEREHPGYDYAPDMNQSKAYETYSENDYFEDGKIMQEPVKGTVPRHMIPHQLVKNKNDRLKAGKELSNPIEYTEQNIQEGRYFFELICQQCHGSNADGKGFLYLNEYYPYPPASLLAETIRKAPDGEIYHLVTVGYNLMGAHGSMMTQDERWKLVHYIRYLQDQFPLKVEH